ncbi:MAG: DUF4150 domain-containing protein [Myxococcales bacterium]|nr:DUF4150 domain-containing protein [Myxococcales bacterium]
MPSVGIHPPKTPITKGSSGIAAATLPNVCKMPGPPAPFVPTPLPNIAKSGTNPKGYSKDVKVEGKTVAIRGASFESMGDAASKGTGGGLLSANTHGPVKFITPGSLTVKIEGKNVHLLGEPVLNNCGPSGSPPNTGATMAGVLQAPQVPGMTAEESKVVCEAFCECQAAYDKGEISGPGCCSKCLQTKLESTAPHNMKSEQSYFVPDDVTQAPTKLTPEVFNTMADRLEGSRLSNFVSGLTKRPGGVPVSAGGSVTPAAGLRMSRACSRVPSGSPLSNMAGHVCRPDIVLEASDGPKVFDAKFSWKNGKDSLSDAQNLDYPRIDADGDPPTVIDRETCNC